MTTFAVLASPAVLAAVVSCDTLTVELRTDGYHKGCLTRLVAPDGRDYASGLKEPFFTLAVRPTNDLTRVVAVLPRHARSVESVERPDGVDLVYSDFTGPVERAVCSVRGGKGERFLRWRLSVTPAKGFALTAVDCPRAGLAKGLGGDPAGEWFVAGSKPWGLVRNPSATLDPNKWEGVGGRQPGALFAQFGSYYDARGGLYLAAEDPTCSDKTLRLHNTRRGLMFTHSRELWSEGASDQPYDFVLSSFTGRDGEPADWYDAADLYKAWARNQYWCRVPLRDRPLPDWMRKASAVVSFRRNWLDSPALIRNWIERYWRTCFPKSPLVGVIWGWEKHDEYVAPDYFPCYPDDATFAQVIRAFEDNDVRFFPWPSSFNVTCTYYGRDPRRPRPFDYDGRAAFDKIRHLAVCKPDGEVLVTRPEWYRGGEMATLCPGDVRTRRWWVDNVSDRLVDRGACAIQFDQANGGSVPPCWSREHGHPPGYGLWRTQSVRAQVDAVSEASRRKGVESMVFSFEDPNEFLLDKVGLQDYRTTRVNSTNRLCASIWNYLYHEFAATFAPNPRLYQHWSLAFCAADGQMPRFVPRETDIDSKTACFANGRFEMAKGEVTPWGWRFRGGPGGGACRRECRGAAGEEVLRLTAGADKPLALYQNRYDIDTDTVIPGSRYRISFLAKTERGKNARLDVGFYDARWHKVAKDAVVDFPKAGEGWRRVSGEFVGLETCTVFHCALVIPSGGEALVDDLVVERLGPDGQGLPMSPDGWEDGYMRFMKQWVAAYGGSGRDFLAFGRQIRPPKVSCASIVAVVSCDSPIRQTVPAVCSAAYETLDGSRRALALANATRKPQPVSWTWKERTFSRTVEPCEVRLENLE